MSSFAYGSSSPDGLSSPSSSPAGFSSPAGPSSPDGPSAPSSSSPAGIKFESFFETSFQRCSFFFQFRENCIFPIYFNLKSLLKSFQAGIFSKWHGLFFKGKKGNPFERSVLLYFSKSLRD